MTRRSKSTAPGPEQLRLPFWDEPTPTTAPCTEDVHHEAAIVAVNEPSTHSYARPAGVPAIARRHAPENQALVGKPARPLRRDLAGELPDGVFILPRGPP